MSDSFDTYLRDISRYPLLSEQEELAVAVAAKLGNQEAEEKLILSNLRLVVKLARDLHRSGFEMLDLVAEGNRGLQKAARKFDAARFKARFSTYAAWWIKREIKRFQNCNGSVVKITNHLVESIRKAGKEGDDSMLDELKNKVPRVESLSAELEDGDPRSYADENAEEPGEALALRDQLRRMRFMLQRLDSRESAVLSAHWGLDGEPRSFAEIGREVNLSRERIRLIHDSAVEAMRKLMGRYEDAPAPRTAR
jgi:RNA polymerase primary sigma factor